MARPPKFLNNLDVREMDNGKDWVLLAPLCYYSVVYGNVISVPAGFVTDFASVPRAPFIYWFAGDTARKAAVIHDWLYRSDTQPVSREQADAVFAEAIDSLGYWQIRQWFMWAGVRIGGAWSFETRSTHSTNPL